MPAAYAHSRFGRQVMASVDAETLQILQKFSGLYRVGLQGPDPLFYYNPFFKNSRTDLACRLHRIPGTELFSGQKADDGQLAYLYGLLAHYCLDSVCHPYVNAVSASGECGHTELETDFDRFLMIRDGIALPHTQNLGEQLSLTPEECGLAAACLPGVSAGDFARSLSNMRLAARILSGNTILTRPLLERVLPKLGSVKDHLMSTEPNPRALRCRDTLFSHYRQAQERYPVLARKLHNHLRHGTPLDEQFIPIMG